MTISTPSQTAKVSTLDILWAFYQSQSKRVRKKFLERVEAQKKAERHEAQMRAYEANLSSEERERLHQMASDIRKRTVEVQEALQQGKRFGRSADDFLAELRSEAE